MPLESKLPAIAVQASLATQKAVEETGQEVEFRALQKAASRRQSGEEMRRIKWVPDKKKPAHSGTVRSGFVTRFHEYGTMYMSARPILGPAAEEVEEHFLGLMSRVYDA